MQPQVIFYCDAVMVANMLGPDNELVVCLDPVSVLLCLLSCYSCLLSCSLLTVNVARRGAHVYHGEVAWEPMGYFGHCGDWRCISCSLRARSFTLERFLKLFQLE